MKTGHERYDAQYLVCLCVSVYLCVCAHVCVCVVEGSGWGFVSDIRNTMRHHVTGYMHSEGVVW